MLRRIKKQQQPYLNERKAKALTKVKDSDFSLPGERPEPLTEASDSTIVSMFLARNEDAIRMVQSVYGSRMTALAQRITGQRSDAEEIVNDVWLAAWNAIPPHEPFGYLFAFLSNITRNAAINRVNFLGRKKRNIPLVEITEELDSCVPDSSDTESAVLSLQVGEFINEFLHSLPKQSRMIFIRRYYFSEPIDVISKRLGMSGGSVRTNLSRTRKQLKAYLEEREVNV